MTTSTTKSWLIGDLLAQGKPPTKEQTQKIYNQEYEEVVAQIQNTLDLSNESPSYPMVPTSLRNLEIILPSRLFQEHRGLLEPPPSLYAWGPGIWLLMAFRVK